MMRLVGYILFLVGAVLAVLQFTSVIALVPRLADVDVPLAVWVGMAVIGAFTIMMTRRIRD